MIVNDHIWSMSFSLMSTDAGPSSQTAGIKFLNSDPLPYSQNNHPHQHDMMLLIMIKIIITRPSKLCKYLTLNFGTFLKEFLVDNF